MNRLPQKILPYCLLSAPVLLVLSRVTFAAASEASSPPAIFDMAYLFQVFGSLLLVSACIFGLLFVLRKLNGIPAGRHKAIQILDSAKLGSREKVVILKAGEAHLLVGVAAGNVRTLHVFDGPENGLNIEGANFASVLDSASQRVDDQ